LRFERECVDVVCPLLLLGLSDERRSKVRAIGLDVHLGLCEVAIAEDGAVRSAGRISTTAEEIELFAQSLGSASGGPVSLRTTRSLVLQRLEPAAAWR
jgi:hypothetical protein